MNKGEIKDFEIFNFNKKIFLKIEEIEYGKTTLILKIGRARKYFLKINKSSNSTFLTLVKFKNETFTEHEQDVNLGHLQVKNDAIISKSFIENFNTIYESIKKIENFKNELYM